MGLVEQAPKNGFPRAASRSYGVQIVCTLFKSRWHGFGAWEVRQRRLIGSGAWERVLERGWCWRGRNAPYYEFGPTSVEIHDDLLVDNRDGP